MLISTDWIKDFVDIPQLTPEEIAERITLATAEVEDVISSGGWMKAVKVAQIKSIEKHPEADKLNLVTFDCGEDSTKRVVCGAGNVKVGLKVPYAPIGTTLPVGFTLEPKKIRGILSEGMLCSTTELGLGENAKGLMELPEDAIVGQDFLKYLDETEDILLDIDNKSLTHRPDLWGHFGLAREYSAAFDVALKDRFTKEWADSLKAKFNKDKSPIVPKVDEDSAGKIYYGLSMDNVKIAASPKWMQRRLSAVGLRPINNIVDIGNYVMLELGMPLHIFDREMIKDNTVHIKRVGSDQKFLTLDDVERDLISSDTVICDSEKPLVIAGIMGGANSGVNDNTNKIFIEVANWKAAEIRRTSTRIGLRTDSSQRYEKSLDNLLCERTALRTLELVLELCPEAKVIGKLEWDGEDLTKIETLKIESSVESICAQLGKEISQEIIVKIFRSLDFTVVEDGSKLSITVPSYRATKDVEYEADLVEEIGRIVGYDNIQPVSPKADIVAVRLSESKVFQRKIQDYMVMSAHALEVYSYPLVGEKLVEKASWPAVSEDLVLVNPVSQDADRMRPSLIPSILEKAAINVKNFADFRMFELGRSYAPDSKNFHNEREQVAIAFYSRKESTFIKVASAVEGLLDYLNLPAELLPHSEGNKKFSNDIIPKTWKGTHPNEYLNIRIMGKFAGAITTIHPLVMRSFKMKGNLAVAIIDITDLQGRKIKDKTRYQPLAKFPSSTFDCTVVTGVKTPVEDLLTVLKKVKVKEIVERKIVDIYPLNEKEKTVTVRVTFLDPNQTLSGDVIKGAEDSVVTALERAGYPLKMS